MMTEESNPQDRQPQEEVTQKVITASDLPVIYTNSSRVWTSFFDFRIVFSEARQTSPSEVTTIEQVAVVMAPEHAKALADVLIKTLEQYEEKFGKLRQVPSPSPAS